MLRVAVLTLYLSLPTHLDFEKVSYYKGFKIASMFLIGRLCVWRKQKVAPKIS